LSKAGKDLVWGIVGRVNRANPLADATGSVIQRWSRTPTPFRRICTIAGVASRLIGPKAFQTWPWLDIARAQNRCRRLPLHAATAPESGLKIHPDRRQ
jgi:hypothetical protein